jgi:uncharacterized cupin superfamily protein
MRIFAKSCVAAAALVTALAPIAHAQTSATTAPSAPSTTSTAVAPSTATAPSTPSAPSAATAPRRAPVFSAYHGVTAGKQTERLNTLRNQGYRPITLTVDNAAAPRYGAVWVKTPTAGPEWVMYRGMTSSGYQNRFNARIAEGYRPTSVSATGSGNDAVFAAIFEKIPGRFTAKHDLNADQFAASNATAARRGYVLTALNAYGTANDPRYIAVWTQAPGTWTVTTALSPREHHQEFLARTSNGEKPSLVTVGPGNTYTAAWVKDDGGLWHEFTDMSSAGYQNRFNNLKNRGFIPVKLDTEDGRYGAIWARD